jgi:predicted nucleic acid-binding protein
MIKVYIDYTGWHALINMCHPHHEQAREYFQQLLDGRTRIYSNREQIDSAINLIKRDCGLDIANEFSQLIDEAVLSTNLRLSWPTRRLRRNSIKLFFSIKEGTVDLHHCYILEEVKKKKINIIFSFDEALKVFTIPLMPPV